MPKFSFMKFLVICCIIAFLFSGCKKDNSNDIPSLYGTGVFIINQGGFNQGNGSVSFFNRYYRNVQNNIFHQANNRQLGDVVQSMALFNDKAYIVVNNSQKVEVVNDSTFKSVGVISGLEQPRYFLGISSSKAYVSQWLDGTSNGSLAVINLINNTVTETIPVGHGPELMLPFDSKVFVINTGGDVVDSTVSVINTSTDTKAADIDVYHIPSGICLDKNNKLWILCSGGINGWQQKTDTYGYLIRINPETYQTEKVLQFPSLSIHPANLVINSSKDVLYYVYNNDIYRFNINDDTLPSSPLIHIDPSLTIYGLGYDNATDYIYAAIIVSYTQDGYFYRYNSTTGAKIDYYRVGIIPSFFVFN